MPTIPTINRGGSGAPAVRAVLSDEVGPRVSALGKQVNELGVRMEKARQSRETNEAVTEAQRRMLENEDRLKEDADGFASWEQTHAESIKDIRDEINEIGDSTVRDAVNARVNTFQVTSEARVRRSARSKEINAGRAAIVNAEDTFSDNYSKMREDIDRETLLDDINEMYDNAADDGVLTFEEAAQRKEQFLNRAEKLRALVDIDENPTEALKNIKAGVYDVDPKDKLVLKEGADREIARELAASKAAQTARQQGTWTEIFDGIDNGTMGRADIDQAHDRIDPETGMRGLSEPGMRALLGHLKRRNKDAAKAVSRRKVYQDAIENAEGLDHKTKEDREAAEQAFLDIADELPDLPPVEANTKIINDILRPLKIWPKSLQRLMRIAAKSANRETIEHFANLYDRVSTDPTVAAINVSMVNEDQAFWETVASFKRSGMFTPENIAMARHNAYDLTDDDRAALKQTYRDKKYTGGNRDTFNQLLNDIDPDRTLMGRLMSGSWSTMTEDAPDAPPGMVADYQNMVKQYYYLTPDIDTARKLAGEAVHRAWTVEEID